MTETWLAEDYVTSAELSCGGQYEVFRKDRTSRGGGVLILVKCYIPCVEINVDCLTSELSACTITLASKEVRIAVAYFSPSGSTSELTDRMEKVIEEFGSIINSDDTFVLAGDLNQAQIDWSTLSTNGANAAKSKEAMLMNFCAEHGLQQFVNTPTRRTATSESLLDVVLCNDDSVSGVEVSPNPICSDHCVIKFLITGGIDENNSMPRVPDYEKGNYIAIQSALDQLNWTSFFENCDSVSAMYELFIKEMHKQIDKHVPPKMIYETPLERHLAELYQALDLEKDIRKLNYLQKEIKKATRRQRVIREHKILRSDDPKTIHNYIRKRIVVRDSLSSIKRSDGTLATDDTEKAQILKNFFEHTYPSNEELDQRNRRAPPRLPDGLLQYVVHDIDVCPTTILKHLKKLQSKKSETPDGIPSFVFKKLGISVCVPLSYIFRQSLDRSEVPDKFRTAIVCPVHKKGPKTEPTNKRPVSLTVVACKLLESIICKAIYENADKQGLLTNAQYAYRPGRSTTLQLLLDTQFDWAEHFNRSSRFDVVYLDFKSAFERVTHSKLLKILPNFGVGDLLVKWISDFLRDRTFRVRVNGKYSNTARATSGCPQGTILGPLMYILYINSIMYIFPPSISVKIYADDVKIYSKADSSVERSTLQRALDNFAEWTADLDLLLTIEKCAVLHFGHGNPRHVYTIGGSPLRNVDTMRDLGVITSTKLKYTEHVTDVVLRATRRANWILRSFVLTDPAIYAKLFLTYVEPIMTYAGPVWYPGLKGDIERLQKVEKMFAKRVAFRCHCERTDVNIAPIFSRLDKIDKLTFVCIGKHLPALMNEMFDLRTSTTRASVNIIPKFIAKKKCVNDLFPWRISRASRDGSSQS